MGRHARRSRGTELAGGRDQGLKFNPADYSIPLALALEVQGLFRRHSEQVEGTRSSASMLWFNLGPGTYELVDDV